MTEIKAFLREIRDEQREISILESKIESVQNALLPDAVKYKAAVVQESNTEDRMAKRIADLVDLKKSLSEARDELIAKQRDATTLIYQLSDSNERSVIILYYLTAPPPTWDKVAEKMHYSVQHVLRIHGNALQNLRKIAGSLKNESK